MIVPGSLRRRSERDESALATLEKEVWETVSNYCRQNDGFAFTGRRKTLQSLAEKIETGRFGKWSDLDDRYGCQIIVPTLAHEGKAVAFLDRAFESVKIAKRNTTQKRPDVFRFDSTRFWGRLRPTGEPLREAASAILFEIQILTAFEYAWSTTTHALGYKTKEMNWTTKRFAAQLRASVEQIDWLVLVAAELAERMPASAWPELDDQQAIIDGFRGMIESGTIPEEMAPDKWSRFAENFYRILNNRSSVADALESCRRKAGGYNAATFPRLVSLHQFVIGTLLEDGRVQLPIKSYTPLLTEELRQVFPGLTSADPNFNLEA
jgi:ppGpp synthetase/RelA/SpoT-type nucleotidyltranferase